MITFEAKIREQTVRLYSELPLKNAASALFKILAQISQKTNIFNNKFVLCFGWAFFYLVERKDEKGEKFWVLQTTDYTKEPSKDRTDDLTTSLVIQNMQVEAVQVAKVSPEGCTYRDTVLVLKEAINADGVYMNRNEKSKDGDSGWYFGLLDDPNEDNHTSDDYEKIPSYKLMGFMPEALRVLQLPVGTVAVFQNKRLTALVDKDDKAMKFTTEEERRKLGAKQREQFEREVREARERALAKQAAESTKQELSEEKKTD